MMYLKIQSSYLCFTGLVAATATKMQSMELHSIKADADGQKQHVRLHARHISGSIHDCCNKEIRRRANDPNEDPIRSGAFEVLEKDCVEHPAEYGCAIAEQANPPVVETPPVEHAPSAAPVMKNFWTWMSQPWFWDDSKPTDQIHESKYECCDKEIRRRARDPDEDPISSIGFQALEKDCLEHPAEYGCA